MREKAKCVSRILAIGEVSFSGRIQKERDGRG